MLMTPTAKPAGQFIDDLPEVGELRAATVWCDGKSPEAVQQRAVAWMKKLEASHRPVRDATTGP